MRRIFVLGMHRSGTSALTGALAAAGLEVGDDDELTGRSWENPRGFFERKDARRVCDALLQSSGADWWKISDFDTTRIPAAALSEQGRAISALRDQMDAGGSWAIKEPRLSLLLPVWAGLVPDACAVVMVRDPHEVARSLRVRNGFPMQAGLALWEAYTAAALRHASKLPASAVLEYSTLIENPRTALEGVIEALGMDADGLDLAAGAAAVDPGLRRNRADAEAVRPLSPAQDALWTALQSGDRPDLTVSPEALAVLREFETDQAALEQLRRSDQAARSQLAGLQAAKEEAESESQRHQALCDQLQQSLEHEALAAETARREARFAQAKADMAFGDRDRALRQFAEQTARRAEAETRLSAASDALGARERHASALSDRLDAALARLRTRAADARWLAAERDAARRDIAPVRAWAESWSGTMGGPLRVRLRAALKMVLRPSRMPAALPEQPDRALRTVVFDARWYGRRHGLGELDDDQARSHYVELGAGEGLDPHPLFDTGWYMSQLYGREALGGRTPLHHYLEIGAAAGLDPHPLFFTLWYLDRHRDVRLRAVNPLEHYVRRGAAEPRWPNPVFDGQWYLGRHRDVARRGANPLAHYVTTGAREGRAFDPQDPGAGAVSVGENLMRLRERAQARLGESPTGP